MKKGLVIFFLFLVLVSGLWAQEAGSITIKNETGYTLNYLYFSPSEYDDWGDDLLAGAVLEDGQEIEIILDREFDGESATYDLQAIDEDGDYYTIFESDITDLLVLSVTMDAYDGGDYEDYSVTDDYESYDDGYSKGYSEGYREGYTEAFKAAYLEGFKAGIEAAAEAGAADQSWRLQQ